MITLTLIFIFIILIYVFLTWNINYWTKRGLKGPKPKLLFGNYPNLLTQKQHFANDATEIYNTYKNTEYFVGTFVLRDPVILLLDPALINEVLINNFNSFHDNNFGELFDPKKDPLFAHNPFILSGAEWREQRQLVSPGLTQSRIKASYPDMLKVCDSFCEYIEKQILHGDWVDGKDLCTRFTAENICRSVLGISSECFTDQAIPVAEQTRAFFSESNSVALTQLVAGLLPGLEKYFRLKFTPQKTEDFFLDLMEQTFAVRRKNPIQRQDYLDYILSLKAKKNLDDVSLASHTMTFLIDGLETTAGVIAHCLLLLGHNPDKANRLREEILENLNEDGNIDFEKLNELPYLDGCIHETLRMYPPAVLLTKVATADHAFKNKDGKQHNIYAGEKVLIPVFSIHHDENLYPKPEDFQPERFLPEEGGVKKYRDMGAFLGFGNGPRICLGMRFGLAQSKLAISTIIKNYIVKSHPKTKMLKLNPKHFLADQHGGIWLKFESI